jgi:hypothetical protein
MLEFPVLCRKFRRFNCCEEFFRFIRYTYSTPLSRYHQYLFNRLPLEEQCRLNPKISLENTSIYVKLRSQIRIDKVHRKKLYQLS